MAHQSRFLSVNLNKSYGKSSSSASPSPASGYGNGRPRSSGGGGMVVLSRPRSSSGAAPHKPASKLSVPPPVNLPSLRKEHERLDPASLKPSAGHGGSGLGPGNCSSMSWTKPTPPVSEVRDKDDGARSLPAGEQRSFGRSDRLQGFKERAVILKGEDFPSLLATSTHSSKQGPKQVRESSDVWEEKAELPSALDMRPQLRSSPVTKSNAHETQRGISRVQNSAEQDANFPSPLPLVSLKHTSDWDDDERDRNRVFSGTNHYDGRVLLNGEARSSLSRDSGRADAFGKEFMDTRKEDRNASSWRVTVQPNRELSTSHLLNADRDHVGPRNSTVSRGMGKESSHDILPYGERREFGFGMGSRNPGVAESSNDRVEVSSNWQKGKPFASGMISKGPMSSRIKGDHAQSFTKEKLISNVGKSYTENATWGGKDTFSSDAMLDLNAKVFRKKKEVILHTDIFDPVRESFEAELEKVQRLQEQERQRVLEEQARVLEYARRESEERERMVREEEERRRLLEEEAREAAWRAEQDKMEAVRRAEEQRIAREEERRKILMEEERRKEAARKKLLELEDKIARRQTEAAAIDRMKETDSSRDSNLANWEKSERMVEHVTSSPLFNSSGMNRLSEAELKPHTSNVENSSVAQHEKPENNWNNSNNLNIKLQDQDRGYPSARQDTFYSNRSFNKKQFQGIHGPKPVTPTFKRGMPNDQTQVGQSWDRNKDYDQVNVRSNVDTVFDGWNHGHFDGNELVSYSERSFQNNEVDDLASFNRIRHTVRQPRVPPPPPLSSSMRKSPFQAASVGANSSFSADTDAQSNQTIRIEESDVQILYDCSYHQRVLEPGTPELLEEAAISLLQTEEKSSPRYDSQSSLSVSNPPSSPTQLSHDEFDDCGGSSALTTSAEDENVNFSEVSPMIPELDTGNIVAELIPFSHGEDDEWAVEDNEEVQEEEEEDHDDGPDSSQEDNKALDSGAEELELKNKLEDLNGVVEKPMEMYDTAYGIDGCCGKINTNHGLVSDSTSVLVYDNSSVNSLQSKVSIPDKIMNTSEIAETTIEAHEDQSFGPVISADQPTVSVRESKSPGPNPIAVSSRFPLSSTSSLCTISASASISSDQYDIPAKLQFGLFSSPPLIPSPIPTIQIGSIHMPLPLSAHIDSYSQMQHSHSPLFQFGQIRYASSISQSALPIGTLNTPFMHPPIARHTLNRNPGSSSNNQLYQKDSTSAKGLDKRRPSFSADKQTVCAREISVPCQSNLDSNQPTALLEAPRHDVLIPRKPLSAAPSDEKITSRPSNSGLDNPDASSNKNFRSMVHSRRTRGRPHFIDSYSSARKSFTGQNATGIISDFKGNRLTYNVRHVGSLSSPIQTEFSYSNANRPQRRARRHIQGTEYRVKETDGARKMQFTENSYYGIHSSKTSLVGAPSRKVGRKGPDTSKSTKLMNEETAFSGSQAACANNNMSRDNRKETIQFSMYSSSKFQGCQENLSKSGILEDDIDAPLQSGIVRVFNQPGIEASSDGDGFVEVRSKRKISNERRGQRERESNSKHRVMKIPHKHHANLPCNGISYKSEISTTLAGVSTVYKSEMITNLAGGSTAKNTHSDLAIAHRRSSTDLEPSRSPISSMEGQMIPPTGSPALNSTDYDTKSNSLKSNQTGCDLVIANDVAKVVPSLSFGNDIVALDKASVPLGNWNTVPLNKKAITSTQSQNDEALNSGEFSLVSSAKDSPDDIKLAISSVAKEKLSFSSEDLLNFPFDGEKIQFGAVAPPLPLPHSSQSVPSGIWPSGSVMLNASIIHNLPVSDHCQSNFFDKEKCTFDDTEAEAEAAASAVAVAAITNDEIIVSQLGTCSISGIGNKVLSGPGMPSCTGVSVQSASEESLVVTLPADLSVDTTLSLWPPLPNLQSSRPMLSHMAGTQPSPFPFFDPNPMLGGPIFAFRPQDESTGTPAQQQQSATFVSGPTGTWPQCHSGVDSFYGSPAGFPAPFMSPPAGLTGVHGHPQMVFYNHFAPVGQFGQVGLSYMGNSYLPTGKQPDWKHSSEGATTVNVKKTDASHLNVVYGQQSAAHMSTPAQHLSSGSAVMQVTSPFTMFNLRPFQVQLFQIWIEAFL
ncbi:hypothetical protein KSP39_PZI010244 [Platanthera zijinensis]|uniref:Uncharacterized protein n=1 Tax=Platanthera zijinensis TaxID=2320716 RepID=A0AAP0G6T5_9ASPA